MCFAAVPVVIQSPSAHGKYALRKPAALKESRRGNEGEICDYLSTTGLLALIRPVLSFYCEWPSESGLWSRMSGAGGTHVCDAGWRHAAG